VFQIIVVSKAEAHNGSRPEVVSLTEEVDLCRLILLQQPVLTGKYFVPANFFVLNLDGDLYTTEKHYNTYMNKTTPYIGDVLLLDDEYDDPERRDTSDALSQTINSNVNRLQDLRAELGVNLDSKIEAAQLRSKEAYKRAQLEKVCLVINCVTVC
jgi:hypothetical protein